MCCPECLCDELTEVSATSFEPHGENHEDVILKCSRGHRFEECDALSESDLRNIAADRNSYYDEQEAA
jgi:hypothetical protein